MLQVDIACPCLMGPLWKLLAMCLFSEKGGDHASSFLPYGELSTVQWQTVLGSGSQEDLGKGIDMDYIIVPFQYPHTHTSNGLSLFS